MLPGASRKGETGDVGAFSLAEKSVLTGLLTAYFLQNLTVFDNITSYLLYAAIIAYIAGKESSARGASPLFEKLVVSRSTLPVIAAAAVILVWAAAWGINQKAFAQNKMLLRAMSSEEGLEKNLEYFTKAIEYGSFGTQEAREQLTQGTMRLVASPDVPEKVKRAFFEASVREMNVQQQESPLDARFPLFLGIVQGAYGDYKEARVSLERAHELSPKKQSILFELARNAQSQGNTADLLQFLKAAYELEPKYEQARIYYAAALIRAGQDGLANDVLAPLIEVGAGANPEIAAAYVSRGRYDKIVTIWKAHVAAHPNDVQAHFTLAAAYYAMGKSQEAIAQLEESARLNPSVKAQADSLIEQIRKGIKI
ncbi:MAG: Tetratricopeptide TPR_1 repeat-containing protein [Parcubacteria group bacterium GW2011_GWA2_51_10]|nr:MAG: Tetratricopeptide TPR_1 repeat-containing protein [Parcubacteria group bacterium GW2011_GWA2_51_10]